MTIQVSVDQGAVRLTLACAKQGEHVAGALMEGHLAAPTEVLGTVDVRAASKLRIAHSTGGPLVHCPSKAAPAKRAP